MGERVVAAKRDYRYGLTVDLVVLECPTCGIVHAIPEDFREAIRKAGRPAHYYCPNGHSQHFIVGETESVVYDDYVE